MCCCYSAERTLLLFRPDFATLSVPLFFPLVATLSRFATEEGEGRERRVVVVVVVAAFAAVLRWMGCVVLTDAFAVGSGRALYRSSRCLSTLVPSDRARAVRAALSAIPVLSLSLSLF